MDHEMNDATGHDSLQDSLQPESVRSGSTQDGTAGPSADHVSDPALNDELGHDWTDEGGATPSGPATEPRTRR